MTKFSDLKLDPKVLQAIAEAGYENPTPIQAGAIPPALEGRDVLGIAQTGTGKTASFTLPMITLLGRGRARARMPRSLVLCPTRELAAQVAENFDVYARHTRLTKALLIGGVSFGEQDKLIDRGVDVLIATPGRLLDHFERGRLLLTGVQIMVVDEADRMLDMGFIPDIERIFQLTPFTRQTLFFSATMAPEIERITNTFLHAPERIEVARQATASETITQKLVELTPTRKDQTAKQKRELLRALIDAEGPETETGGLKNAIIFCNRKTEVDIVAKSLKAHGYDAAPIHGDLDQRVRMQTLDGFREGTLRFLVASDVAARGLDIPAVSHVFNFDLPSHAEDYVHRIGRTGRAGRQGTAFSIATPSDDKYLAAIEALVKQTLPRVPLPEGFSLSEAAQSAPGEREGRSGERGGRERSLSRTRSRNRRADAAPPAATLPAAAPQAEPAARAERPAPETRREDGAGERRDSRRPSEPAIRADQAGRAEQTGRAEQGAERRERDRGRDRDRDRGPAVVGFGELVPDFMTSSFAQALAVTEARASAAAARPADDASVGEGVPADEDAAPRSRGRRGRGRKGVAAEAAAAADAAVQPPRDGGDAGAIAAHPAPDARADARSNAAISDMAGPAEGSEARTDATGTGAAGTDAAGTDAAGTDGPGAGKAGDKAAQPRSSRRRRKEPAAPLPEEAEAAQPDMTLSPAAEAAVLTESLPADALPEERDAAAAIEDGSLGTLPDPAEAQAPADDSAEAVTAEDVPVEGRAAKGRQAESGAADGQAAKGRASRKGPAKGRAAKAATARAAADPATADAAAQDVATADAAAAADENAAPAPTPRRTRAPRKPRAAAVNAADAPAAEAPTEDAPAAAAPSLDAPSSDAPATDAPATGAPAPTADQPAGQPSGATIDPAADFAAEPASRHPAGGEPAPFTEAGHDPSPSDRA